MDPVTSAKVESLSDAIAGARRKGLWTVGVIGAGVSTAAGIPLLSGMTERIRQICELSFPRELERLRPYFGEPGDRANTARLFASLQGHPSDDSVEVWRQFQDWLINDVRILQAKPTAAHRAVAGLYGCGRFLCISTNFDGLTHLAIQEAAEKEEKREGRPPSWRRHVLSSPDDLEACFLNADREAGPAPTIYPVVKLNGDVLHATCTGRTCPNSRRAMPVHGLRDRPKPLTCECGADMTLQLRFPGELQKEEGNKMILDVLWRYLFGGVAVVVCSGISARWDDALLGMLHELRKAGSEVYYIGPEDAPGVCSSRVVTDVLGGDIRYWIAGPADLVFPHIEAASSRRVGQKVHAGYHTAGVLSDALWDPVFGPSDASPVEAAVMAAPELFALKGRAQLSGIERWAKGVTTTRAEHSVGVARVADHLYCEWLGSRSHPEERQLLRLAALSHDIGHIPFSHLMEEVFDDLGWHLTGGSRTFDHSYYTVQLLPALMARPSVSAVCNLGPFGVRDLGRLIEGCLGIPYLDALLNSGFDCDKIDYVFRDAAAHHEPIEVEPTELITELVEDTVVDTFGLLRLGSRATEALRAFLDSRMRLYEHLYFSDRFRLGIAAVKYVLTTYVLHRLDFEGIHLLDPRRRWSEADTLGPAKIRCTLDLFAGEDFQNNEDLIIDSACRHLMAMEYLDERFVDGVRSAKSVIETEDMPKEHRARLLMDAVGFAGDRDTRRSLDHIRKDIEAWYPGALLVDVVSMPRRFSHSEARAAPPYPRMDGTCSHLETTLVRPRRPERGELGPWEPAADWALRAHQPTRTDVRVYRLADNQDYAHEALDCLKSGLVRSGLGGL